MKKTLKLYCALISKREFLIKILIYNMKLVINILLSYYGFPYFLVESGLNDFLIEHIKENVKKENDYSNYQLLIYFGGGFIVILIYICCNYECLPPPADSANSIISTDSHPILSTH